MSWGCIITIKVGASGGSPWNLPLIPEPIKNDGLIHMQGNIIPFKGTLIDSITIPTAFSTTSTGDIVGKLATSTIWTVNATDINANADGFVGVRAFWYDNTNVKLFVFALDQGTSPDTLYTKYITLETGNITDVGSVQLGTDPTNLQNSMACCIQRSSITSGNFTLRCMNRDIVINESSGAEVSNVAAANVTENAFVGNYATLDGTITLSFITDSSTTQTMQLTRGLNSVEIPFVPNIFANGEASIAVINWGDKIKILELSTNGNTTILRTMNRVFFDAWLQLMADYGGLA